MQIRTVRQDERETLLDLLDGWALPDGWQGRDFFRRYMEVDPTYEDRNVWVAEEAGRFVSCVQIFPRRLRLLGHAVPSGGIGSVFTHPDHRERGTASALLGRCVEAMVERGFELSILFAARTAWYTSLGWHSWVCQRSVLRLADPDSNAPVEAGLEVAPFDWERDFDQVRAIHSAYSATRNGTVVRDTALWSASFRLAGNPIEDFWVVRRGDKVLAYVRATLLNTVFQVTELGRLDEGSDALAILLAEILRPRDRDALVPEGKTSRELRSFAVMPAFDDIPLTVALEHRRVATSPMDDPSTMLRCLNADALAERLDVSLLPDESAHEFLTRLVPRDHVVFWTADRF